MKHISRSRFMVMSAAAFTSLGRPLFARADEPDFDSRLPSYGVEMYDGSFTGFSSATQWNTVLEGYRRAWIADPGTKLALHFHGGLVDGSSGRLGASALLPQYLQAGVYPIFVIWHSGPQEAFPPVIFNQGGPIASPHGLLNRGTMLGRRIVERNDNQSCHPSVDATEERLRLFNIASGPDAWAFMKDEIDHSFTHGNAFDVFLAWLADFTASQGSFPNITLIGHSAGAIYVCRLIQEFERVVRSSLDVPPPLASATFHVIFSAAAVRFDLFNETLELNRISDFRLFTMSDFLEQNDEVARDVVLSNVSNDFQLASQITATYPHSLLYLISGVLEDAPDTPLVGMDRFWHDPLFRTNTLIVAVKNQLNSLYDEEAKYLVLSKTPEDNPEGYRSSATTHGDFDWNDSDTVKSVRHILSFGFRDGAQPKNTSEPWINC